MNARNSIWPGKINAKPKLMLDIIIVMRRLTDIMSCNLYKFKVSVKDCKLHIRITKFCNIVTHTVKSIVAIIIVFLDVNGVTSNLFKKPNSLSNTKGNPAFKDPVKHVKIRMPQFKN